MKILQERGKSYGPIGPNMERIAALWSAYLDTPITGHDVAWMMVLLKISRSRQDPSHADNYLDAQGYTTIAEMLQ